MTHEGLSQEVKAMIYVRSQEVAGGIVRDTDWPSLG
jgi:hypothetical protein